MKKKNWTGENYDWVMLAIIFVIASGLTIIFLGTLYGK